MTKEEAFQKKIKQLIEEADSLKGDGVKRALRLLEEARKNIASTVATTEWEIYRLGEMKKAVDEAMKQFGEKYGTALSASQGDLFEKGIAMVDIPLAEIGITTSFAAIDMTMLGVLQGFGADLITGLSKEAAAKINKEITLALMGQKTPYEAMEAIGKNLKDKGIFKSIADRAEAITRTEGGRALSVAAQARMEKAAKVVDGLEKEWRHSHISNTPRQAHLDIEGKHIPVDDVFYVNGESLSYPRDPKGSAKNTVRCECYTIPYHANWDKAVDKLKKAA